ncbi:hypothetical protein H0H81_005591, partial [Sphagnurus paluster]
MGEEDSQGTFALWYRKKNDEDGDLSNKFYGRGLAEITNAIADRDDLRVRDIVKLQVKECQGATKAREYWSDLNGGEDVVKETTISSWQGSISRDGFTYDGRSFYVEVDSHRHARASPSSLRELLTYIDPGPLLTKKGTVAKRQPKSHPDPPAHYYQAQCIHYGLHPYEQRPVAKKHLLAAFESGNGTIAVPEHIQALGREMRAEYEVANANAIAQEKAGAQETRKKKRGVERLRQREEADGMVKEFR